jgi:predicted aldo/keto reductase-like oxidoreductase
MNAPLHLNRRQFLRQAAAAAALASLPSARAAVVPRTATDQVTLGNTGLKLSRLGMGAGSNSGNIQRALGHEGFNRLVRHAYDRGITYIDTAQSYQTHEWIREAVRGLPREKLFIQTKISGDQENPLALIDRFRSELGMDYVDTLLVHCVVTPKWEEERKRTLDAIAEAKAKQWVKAQGVSCHSLPALRRAGELGCNQVHLVRLNPQGAHIDTPVEHWDAKSDASHLPPVVAEIKALRAKGRGIIGMKLIGNGDFTQPEQREQSIRYAMQSGLLDAVVIGFKSPAEIDEAIERINRALAQPV